MRYFNILEAKEKEDGPTKSGTATYKHWLMKSEPETRLENGVDVKVSFSTFSCRGL